MNKLFMLGTDPRLRQPACHHRAQSKIIVPTITQTDNHKNRDVICLHFCIKCACTVETHARVRRL